MTNTWTSDQALFRLTVANLAATPPVSAAEERRLIEVMFAGQEAAKQLAADSALTPAQRESGTTYRTSLEAKKEEGAAARKMLIQANGRLVISIAVQYQGKGLSLAELCQEGVMGLIRAIDKFDKSKGTRLSTYATYWIRHMISRAVAGQTRVIHLPVHKVERLGKIRKVTEKLTKELGHSPDLEEIAARTGETPEQLRELFREGQETLSLEEPVGEDGSTLGDFVANDVIQDMEDQVDLTLLEDRIHSALSELSARESRILELRFGLHNGQPLTLRDVAERFGLTRERIRQLEKEALEKLRQPNLANQLADFA